MLYNLIQQFPNDSGPIYQETIAGRLPVEPFNTLSNLVFIYIIYYFWKRVKNDPKKHAFLVFCLPIIFISWVGGTVFHGTRSHEFWLALDWMPILFLCGSGVAYFIWKLRSKLSQRLFLFSGLIILSILPRFISIGSKYDTSFGYFITAVTVVIPFICYAYKTNWKNARYILYAIVIFALAVTLRTLDNTMVLLPMGTHWLWHTFGGIAVFFLLKYIYLDNIKDA